MSSMPVGKIRHASGSNLTFSQFTQAPLTSNYDLGPSVVSTNSSDGSYELGLKDMPSTGVTGMTRVTVVDGVATVFPTVAPVSVSLASGTDSLYFPIATGSLYRLVAYDKNGQLQILVYAAAGPSNTWEATTYFDPPSGTTFQYSPSICQARSYSVEGDRPHLVVTAGNRLWHTESVAYVWSAWKQISNTEVVTSPDCVVTDDTSIGMVATTASGSVIHVRGANGTFTETDLGRQGG